jgi:hypothetical protein
VEVIELGEKKGKLISVREVTDALLNQERNLQTSLEYLPVL